MAFSQAARLFFDHDVCGHHHVEVARHGLDAHGVRANGVSLAAAAGRHSAQRDYK